MQLENSTNVRADSAGGCTRLIHELPPDAAAALASEMFLTPPPRRPTRPEEARVFAAAERFELEFEGERLPVFRFGRGPAVLLVHGWGGSSHQLHAFVEPLRARGASVVAFDAPAHGQASGSWLAIPRFAQAIARVAEHVGPLAAVVGHSMGAAAGAFAIGRGLPAARAVLIGPPASEYEFFQGWMRSLGLGEPLIELTKHGVERRVGVSFEALGPQPIAAGVSGPMLVIHDQDDREVPWADGAAIAAAALDARLITTRGLGHRRILRDPGVIEASVAFALGEHKLHTETTASFVAAM
jgi:pimeloyl-ACP methyl ester carboxylesterase